MNQLIVDFLQDNINQHTYDAKYFCNVYYQYHEKNAKDYLRVELKQRSEYKRALKEYKKQCEQIWIQKYEKQIQLWKKNPIKFVEEMYGCKLLPYQKFMLKMVWNK
jgi:hypothetical protein